MTRRRINLVLEAIALIALALAIATIIAAPTRGHEGEVHVTVD